MAGCKSGASTAIAKEQSIELIHENNPQDPHAAIATGAGVERQGRRRNNSQAQPVAERTMQDGPLRDQKGIARETSPTITGERDTSREMRANSALGYMAESNRQPTCSSCLSRTL